LKTSKLARLIFPVHINIIHASEPGAVATPCYCTVHRFLLSFKHGLHPAIGQVSDPSCKAFAQGHGLSFCTKEYTLHPASYNNTGLNPHFRLPCQGFLDFFSFEQLK
jgi:hypothetical protein